MENKARSIDDSRGGRLQDLRYGRYSEQLARYFTQSDRAQIPIYLHERLVADGDGRVPDMLSFVGVDVDRPPRPTVAYNTADVPRRVHWDRWLTLRSRLKTVVKRMGPRQMVNTLARVQNRLKNANFRPTPALPVELRHHLTESYYGDKIPGVSEMLAINLSSWWGDGVFGSYREAS